MTSSPLRRTPKAARRTRSWRVVRRWSVSTGPCTDCPRDSGRHSCCAPSRDWTLPARRWPWAAPLSRLNRGRHAALAALDSRRSASRWASWLPAAGVAAAAVAVVVVMRGTTEVAGVEQPVTATDFEMLLDEQSLEMLEELEFYSWLESVDLTAGDHVG